ncbi:lycopene cyclase domain-containing protein [Sphingobacterium sp. CZ-2]|uniref:lycopene cyclase domain-containing protein n=1 Tax=Sphingobacterium sp. CZ-2 TaxID=2557994 RepID=UPI001070102B|nr:lycopene cyclase domain-containing protein [Sphingobacterium sp. CZ-2]QBR13260.1 lycopene cyclase domain-containing protein [Sphingobacterium sp. CZ-2]
MIQFTYLLINILTISICFIFSFDKRIRFDRYFMDFLKAATLVAIPFIIWDAWFTKIGIWWFNETYLLGIPLAGLPLEEILFFFCIPFSCVFTYFCLNKFFNLEWMNAFNNIIVWLTVIVTSVIALRFHELQYTFVTALVTLLSILILNFGLKMESIGKVSFIYGLLMLGFLPVNGVLTGTGLESPIVNYNSNEFMNIRIGTIPIEDAVYGYVLIIWNVFFFEKFSHEKKSRDKK